MKKLLLFLSLFTLYLHANKVVYVTYEKTPTRVVKGEIFALTLKSLSTLKEFDDIAYNFSNHSGLKLLNALPQREDKGKFYYDTFHFLVNKGKAKLPDVEAYVLASQEYNSTFIQGETLKVVTLNPKDDFSNIVANNLELLKYKTTSYDNKHNIVVFVAQAFNTKIDTMHFTNVYKQGIESSSNTINISRITYYVVIDKKIEKFKFSYFNLEHNKFQNLVIPILVDDDSVTTQSDIKPKDQSKQRLKITIASIVALFWFIVILWKRKYVFLLFILLPLAYILYLSRPTDYVCIKQGSSIYLLPVQNGTVFETTQTKYRLPKEGATKKFTKVKLYNKKIGWVKNENICTY